MSKKKKPIYKQIRKVWKINPKTRVVPNKKRYDRKRDKERIRKEILEEFE